MKISKEYLAGFIDGEGCIAIYKHKDKRIEKGFVLSPRFEISNTNEIILKAIQKEIGGKIKTKPKNKNCKPVYSVEFQDYKNIKNILETLLPFFVVKHKQAKLMIEFCENRIERNGKKYTERDYEIADVFSTINKRGEK